MFCADALVITWKPNLLSIQNCQNKTPENNDSLKFLLLRVLDERGAFAGLRWIGEIYCGIFTHPIVLEDLQIHTIYVFSKNKGERSDLGLCPWDWSTRYCTNRRERPSLLDLLSEFGLFSDGWLGSISPLEIGPMHLSVEGLRPWDWSYPVLQYLREWPTPTVVSSLSRVLS